MILEKELLVPTPVSMCNKQNPRMFAAAHKSELGLWVEFQSRSSEIIDIRVVWNAA